MNKIFFLLSALVLILSGCKKETSVNLASYHNVRATVLRANPNAIGSCGWTIRLDYANYHAINLDTTHLSSGQSVNIDYTLTNDSFVCGDIADVYLRSIRIDSIR